MKVTIPNELKADLPQNNYGKILGATPVVMAVVATLLAGLASSEMTRAQYDRSLAAQQQSKAGDQWSFFQAKRLRGALQRNAVDLLQNTTDLHPFNPAELQRCVEQIPMLEAVAGGAEGNKVKKEFLTLLATPAAKQTVAALQRGELPASAGTPLAASVKTALDGLENLRTDAEMAELLKTVTEATLEDAVRAARDRTQAFDAATKPVNLMIDQIDDHVLRLAAARADQPVVAGGTNGPTLVSASRSFTAARLRYAALRYETEARLNQSIANLYELQVRKSNISAERHHRRSQRFFFGLLGAQMGVIISTLAMAARMRNLLWSLAAAAGLLAVAFSIYVFLCV